MKLEEVKNLCKVLDCSATINMRVVPEAEEKIDSVSIYKIDREKILSKARELSLLGISNFTKQFFSFQGGLDWNAEVDGTKICFNKAQTCKIVGYETKIIPATPATEEKKVEEPIWECNGVRKDK